MIPLADFVSCYVRGTEHLNREQSKYLVKTFEEIKKKLEELK